MSQSFATSGSISLTHAFSNADIIAIETALDAIFAGIEDVTIERKAGNIGFSAYGEVACCDDIPQDLQNMAITHGLTFKAMVNENDEGEAVRFFGDNPHLIQKLKLEHAREVSLAALKDAGVDTDWAESMLTVIIESPNGIVTFGPKI